MYSLYQKLKKNRLYWLVWLSFLLSFFIFVNSIYASTNFDSYTNGQAIQNESEYWIKAAGGNCFINNTVYGDSSPNSLWCNHNYNNGGTVYNPDGITNFNDIIINYRFATTTKKDIDFTFFHSEDGTYTAGKERIRVYTNGGNFNISATSTNTTINAIPNDTNWHYINIQASSTASYVRACLDSTCSSWLSATNKNVDSLVLLSNTYNKEYDYYIDDIVINYITEISGQYSLIWQYPQNGYLINNSEWSDWNLYYILPSTYNYKNSIISINYTDSITTYNDTDLVLSTTTSAVHGYTINRNNKLTGTTTAIATLYSSNCDNPYETTCEWVFGTSTEITFFATSTGRTIFEYGITGFTPYATSTEDYTNGIFGYLRNLFPVNIIMDIIDIAGAIKNYPYDYGNTEANLKLSDILTNEAAAVVDDSAVLLNSDQVDSKFPFWNNTIRPAIAGLLWILNILFIYFAFFMRKAEDKN